MASGQRTRFNCSVTREWLVGCGSNRIALQIVRSDVNGPAHTQATGTFALLVFLHIELIAIDVGTLSIA